MLWENPSSVEKGIAMRGYWSADFINKVQSHHIQMRDAVSQPSLDIDESYFSKNTLFFFKNDFLFYYLKLYTPPVPLIWVFEAFFGPPFCSLTKGKEEKDGSSKVGTRGKSGSVCSAAALIWMINSHLNRTALYAVALLRRQTTQNKK